MSLTKRALSEEALDALEYVDEGLMTEEEWQRRYARFLPQDHDCHLINGEDGCGHWSHNVDS